MRRLQITENRRHYMQQGWLLIHTTLFQLHVCMYTRLKCKMLLPLWSVVLKISLENCTWPCLSLAWFIFCVDPNSNIMPMTDFGDHSIRYENVRQSGFIAQLMVIPYKTFPKKNIVFDYFLLCISGFLCGSVRRDSSVTLLKSSDCHHCSVANSCPTLQPYGL